MERFGTLREDEGGDSVVAEEAPVEDFLAPPNLSCIFLKLERLAMLL